MIISGNRSITSDECSIILSKSIIAHSNIYSCVLCDRAYISRSNSDSVNIDTRIDIYVFGVIAAEDRRIAASWNYISRPVGIF
jgi:hypothetical protein